MPLETSHWSTKHYGYHTLCSFIKASLPHREYRNPTSRESTKRKGHIKKVFHFPEGNREFNHITKTSLSQALKTLQCEPYMTVEVTYKLRADVNNRVLAKLTNFIKLPEVIEARINLKEAQKFITLAPAHLVTNVNSKTPPARMVVAAHCPHLHTKQSISDALRSGHHGLPSLQKTILRFGLSVSIDLADLNYYYRRPKIDPLRSLTNTTWHQGKEGSS